MPCNDPAPFIVCQQGSGFRVSGQRAAGGVSAQSFFSPQPLISSGRLDGEVYEAIESASPFFAAFQDLIALPATGLDTRALMDTVMGIRKGYQAFWQRPFPEGLEAGQPLFSAVMERPMRELLKSLKQISRQANDDVAADSTPQLFLDAEEEMACFQAWREEQEEKQTYQYESTASKGAGLGSLALAFGLGWLFGNDD